MIHGRFFGGFTEDRWRRLEEAGRRLGGGWEEAGSRLGGGREAGRRLGGGWEEAGRRLGGGW